MKMEKPCDQNKIAAAMRAKLAISMRTQTEVAQRIGISRDLLNKFLRRKINLLDTQIVELLREVGLDNEEIPNLLSFFCEERCTGTTQRARE